MPGICEECYWKQKSQDDSAATSVPTQTEASSSSPTATLRAASEASSGICNPRKDTGNGDRRESCSQAPSSSPLRPRPVAGERQRASTPGSVNDPARSVDGGDEDDDLASSLNAGYMARQKRRPARSDSGSEDKELLLARAAVESLLRGVQALTKAEKAEAKAGADDETAAEGSRSRSHRPSRRPNTRAEPKTREPRDMVLDLEEHDDGNRDGGPKWNTRSADAPQIPEKGKSLRVRISKFEPKIIGYDGGEGCEWHPPVGHQRAITTIRQPATG